MKENEKIKIISLFVHVISFEEALQWVFHAAVNKQAGFVCFANVHMTIEAYNDSTFAQELQKSSLILADGRPLSKVMEWISGKPIERVAGMDFLPEFLNYANKQTPSTPVFLLGGEESTLSAIEERIKKEYPQITIAGSYAPPFKVWDKDENDKIVHKIQNSGAQVVFVSLGCPKQERWMATHFHNTNTVMLGVGGAFAVFSGKQLRAPKWMQNTGLEWLFRLWQEPGRLTKRYVYTNSLFILLLVKQIIVRTFRFDK